MKKILMVYLPFCTPASPPYSVTAMHSFLQANCTEADVKVLDLNIAFHTLKFPEFQKYYKNMDEWDSYEEKTKEYLEISSKVYSENNAKVIVGKKPEFFEELLEKITDEKPDIVAFSIVYSSQAFFARNMLESLKKLGITTVIGGPSINEKIVELADYSFPNEIEFLEFIEGKKIEHDNLNFDYFPDFSVWDLDSYFTPSNIIPLKTTSTCPYQRCAFCAHYSSVPYREYDIESLKKTIVSSGQKHFFIIDDMISKQQLLKFAEMIKPLNCFYACQLKPTKEWDYETLKILKESGCIMLQWGIESGNKRILDLIEKGTNPSDIAVVLQNSHKAGISNIAYIIFGFPTETKEEFKETIAFLESNKEYIDLISPTVFGLQQGTPIFKNPEKYGITKIITEERTVLEPKISYEVSSGLTQKEASRLKGRHKKMIWNMNNFPKSMNFFREHMMCVLTGD